GRIDTDQDLIYPASVHIDDLEVYVVVIEPLTRLWYASQVLENEPRYGIDLFLGFYARHFLDYVHREHTVDEPRAVFPLHYSGLEILVELGEIPGNRFQDVRDRDEPFRRPVFVHDDGNVDLLLLEHVEEPEDGSAFGNEKYG